MKGASRRKTALICIIASVAAVAFAGTALPAGPEKKQPPAKYWMSVATQNLSIPGMPADMPPMGGMFGSRMGGPGRSLLLQLNSPLPLPDNAEATHDIPPGQKMGDTLPLSIPPRLKEEPAEEAPERKEHYEKPKMRMLIYWGCGEKVRAGQPRVLDTEKMSPMEFGKAMAGRVSSPQYPPAPRKGWTYAEWPNEKRRVDVPKDGSLAGEHFIHGNYTPDIRFPLTGKQDFMAPVEFTSVKGDRTESIKFQWRTIPTAIGYFASAMAHNEKTGEMILWTSSEAPEPGYGLMDYLPSTDVRRFIKEKVVMPPEATKCAIPQGIFKDAEGSMLQFIAYGEDLLLAYPPKPKDPKKPWNPVWTAKVRLKSTGMSPVGSPEQNEMERPGERKRSGERPGNSQEQKERPKEKDEGVKPLNVIKGLFGF